MSYTLKDETYKSHTLRIESDDDAQSPSEWDNTDAFLCGWHSDFHVPPPGMKDSRDTQAWLDAFRATHWIYPIEAYIHSGVCLALQSEGNFPGRQWDVSGNCGAVFLAKEHWKTRDSKKARAAALATVEEWNQYLSGDVWGYVVEHGDWEDSCWGFYGDEYCEQEAREVIDWHVEQLRKDRQEQVKTWIRNKVPLHVRAA